MVVNIIFPQEKYFDRTFPNVKISRENYLSHSLRSQLYVKNT